MGGWAQSAGEEPYWLSRSVRTILFLALALTAAGGLRVFSNADRGVS